VMRTAEDRSVRLASVNRRAHWDDSVVDEDGHWTGECAGNARHGEPPQHDSLGVATRIQVPETTVDLLVDLLEREPPARRVAPLSHPVPTEVR
jgi:hypothetical protein